MSDKESKVILLPTAALYIRYGTETRIEPNDAELLLPLVGAMIVSFLAGVLSARLLRPSTDGFAAVFQAITRAFRVSEHKSSQASRAA